MLFAGPGVVPGVRRRARDTTGRGADSRRRSRRHDAAHRNGACASGREAGCSTAARDSAASARWDQARLPRAARERHAHAQRAAEKSRLVQQRPHNYVPTNTAAGHATIATGRIPGARNHRQRPARPRAAQAPRHDGRLESARPGGAHAPGRLAGAHRRQGACDCSRQQRPVEHRARRTRRCQVSGAKTVHAGYDENAGVWKTNAECF